MSATHSTNDDDVLLGLDLDDVLEEHEHAADSGYYRARVGGNTIHSLPYAIERLMNAPWEDL